MKFASLLICALLPIPAIGKEEKISLVPSNKLGARNGGVFHNIQWNADSEWFHKPAPVCKVGGKRMELSKFHELAKDYGMKPKWLDRWADQYGPLSEGAFYYCSEKTAKGILVANGNPLRGKFMFKVASYWDFPRDENLTAVVQPLPSKEECVVIAREWMKKLNIDENELYRNGREPGGFDIVFRIDFEGGNDHQTKEHKEWDYGMTLNFAQQVGGLPVRWHGFGGTLVCEIGDGGEFCAMYGTLRPWRKIGDYPVLNREEITTALKERFFWSDTPFRCEQIEVVKVDLEVYQAIDTVQQKDFPLIYILYCKLHGGESDGQEVNLLIPALKQHRQRYGKAPDFDPALLNPDFKPPAVPESEKI